MTYQEASKYLDSFINYENRDRWEYDKSFKLERMKRLCRLLGDPHKSIRSVHVAGTKGKGSTSALIQSILKSAGFKAGLYTSPHLETFRERIRIGDDMIGQSDVGELADELKRAVDLMPDDKPSFFEVYTALAFLYFKKEDVDIAVYEVGLGGRLDATNVIEPLVAAITPVSYDHTHILGAELAEIAREKAGIIKEGSVCVSAPQDPEALCAIEKACAEASAQLILAGRDIKFKEISASDKDEVFEVVSIFDKYPNLHMKMLGLHQVVNAAVAIGAVEALRVHGISVSADAVRRGIALARWPGRLELVRSRSPRILLDGAQNGASAEALSREVRRSFKYKRLILVLGVCKDKDIKGILKRLVPIADLIVLTKSAVADRAMDPGQIKVLITPKSKEIVTTNNVKEALDKAVSAAGQSDLVLVTGSLFVVAQARSIIMKGA